jgi:hypothetical protein
MIHLQLLSNKVLSLLEPALEENELWEPCLFGLSCGLWPVHGKYLDYFCLRNPGHGDWLPVSYVSQSVGKAVSQAQTSQARDRHQSCSPPPLTIRDIIKLFQ